VRGFSCRKNLVLGGIKLVSFFLDEGRVVSLKRALFLEKKLAKIKGAKYLATLGRISLRSSLRETTSFFF